jgi:serine/threonine protein kinase
MTAEVKVFLKAGNLRQPDPFTFSAVSTGAIALTNSFHNLCYEILPESGLNWIHEGTSVPLNKDLKLGDQHVVTGDTFELTGPLKSLIPDFRDIPNRVWGDFEKKQRLGAGGFGEVWLCTDRGIGTEYAIKTLTVYDPSKQENVIHLAREIEILHHHESPCVLGLRGIIRPSAKSRAPSLILPYIPRGSLQALLDQGVDRAPPGFGFSERYIIAYGTCVAMTELHARCIIHRDLKPDNVLLNDDFYPVLTDFGLSKVMPPGSNLQSMSGGTLIYQAPEVLQGAEDFDQSCDVFSFGCTLFAIFAGIPPFSPKTTNYMHTNNLLKGVRPAIPASVPPAIGELITNAWSGNPSQRPSFAQMLADFESDKLLAGVNTLKFAAYQEFLGRDSGAGLGGFYETIAPRSPLDALKQAADARDPSSEFRYSQMLEAGEGVEQDHGLAREYLKRAHKDNVDAANRHAKCPEATLRYAIRQLSSNFGSQSVIVRRRTQSAPDDLALASTDPLPARVPPPASGFRKLDSLLATDIPSGLRAEALLHQGLALKHGLGTARNADEAARRFREAAELHHPRAEAEFAHCLQTGQGGERDRKRASEFVKSASKHGHPAAMFHHAMLLQFGLVGVDKNVDEAMVLCKFAASNKYWRAYFYLAAAYSRRLEGLPPDEVLTEQFMRNGEEREVVGSMYQYAMFLGRDSERGRELLEKLSEPRWVDEQVFYGKQFEHYARDLDAAVEMYRIAMENRSREGQFNLARLLFARGQQKEGIELMTQLTKESRDSAFAADAKAFLGRLKFEGKIPKEADDEDLRLLVEAERAGCAEGALMLARLHSARNPGSQSVVIQLLQKAADRGSAEAAADLAKALSHAKKPLAEIKKWKQEAVAMDEDSKMFWIIAEEPDCG